MIILLGWGLSNVGQAFRVKAFRGTQASVRGYFWQMSGLWGIINAVIAISALIGMAKIITADAAYQQKQIEVLGLNIFLDVAYAIIGLIIIISAHKSYRRLGYGRAIIAQGTFLLGLDVVLYLTLKQM